MDAHGVTKNAPFRAAANGGRLFPLEDANRALPLVRRIAADIVRQQKKVCDIEEKCLVPGAGQAGGEDLVALRRRYDVELNKLHELTDELNAIGCEVKDVHRGIVDFRTVYRGREVEFCWRPGDEKIEFWHELNDGFHDRRMIDADFTAEVADAESSL